MSHGKTILLVDDEAQIAKLLRLFLEADGYRVITATDPLDALELFRQECHGIDLMVTDVMMPNMNGYQLAAEARTVNPQLRVLYVSGYTGTTKRDSEIPDGDYIIAKPVSRGILSDAVAAILDGIDPALFHTDP